MKNQIAIHGSYYAQNFGDTLILSVINNWVQELSSGQIVVNLPYINSEAEAEQIMGGRQYVVDPTLKNTKALIFGPGGYFGQPSGSLFSLYRWYWRNYKRHLAWNQYLIRNDIPYGIVGVGVGPISNTVMRSRITRLFNGASFISVRDSTSKEYLVKWGIDADRINIASDVALTLKRDTVREFTERRRIGIHFPGRSLYESNKMTEFVDFIKLLIKEHDVVLLEDQKGAATVQSKFSLFTALQDSSIDLPVIEYQSPKQLIGDIQDLDGIVTSKLHVGIVGHALEVPAMSIPLHPKTKRFYEQINRGEYCLDISSIESRRLYEIFIKCLSLPVDSNPARLNSSSNKEIVTGFLQRLVY